MFRCDCYGLCCMNLKMTELYADLDRGYAVALAASCALSIVTGKLISTDIEIKNWKY